MNHKNKVHLIKRYEALGNFVTYCGRRGNKRLVADPLITTNELQQCTCRVCVRVLNDVGGRK